MSELGLSRLREFLFKEFNEEELAALCQDIGLNYERLPGEGAFGKTRGMIEAVHARGLTPLLMSRVRDLRPAAYRIAGIRAPAPRHEPPVKAPTAKARAAKPKSHPRRTAVIAIIILVVLISLCGVTLNRWLVTQRGDSQNSASYLSVTATHFVTPSVTAKPSTTSATPAIKATLTKLPATPTAADPQTQTTMTPAPTEQPASTPTPAEVTAAPSPTSSPTSTPIATLTATAVPAEPVQTVLNANDLLVSYYSGNNVANSLRKVWAADTYTYVITYPEKMVLRSLGVEVQPGNGLTVTMSYINPPVVVSQNNGRVRLTSRELWIYGAADNVVCETVDYSYTLVKPADAYLIVAYQGDVTATNTGSSCP